MATTVQRLGRTTNLIHGFIYFAPQAAAEFEALGLTGRQQYFAGRAAAMGAVDATAVVDSFYNFNPQIVHDAIPSAWGVADPAAVQAARFVAAAQVLGETCDHVEAAALQRATEITSKMVAGVGDKGKPLAASNRAVELPTNPLVRLWQLVTIVREWRGDAHVQALRDAEVSGIEALVLHAATGQVPTAVLKKTRAWSDDEWKHATAALGDRGLVHADGTFTSDGETFRKDIEGQTNRDSQALVDAVGDVEANELCDLLRPVRDALLASGVFSNALG